MNECVKYTARSQMRCSNLSNLSSFHKIRLALFHLSVRTVERILDFLYNVHDYMEILLSCVLVSILNSSKLVKANYE